MNKQKRTNTFFLLLLLFFFFRVCFCYFMGWKEIPVDSDGFSYNKYALAVLHQSDWLTNASFLGNYRPPVYPLFLSLVYFFFGEENLFAVYVLQCIFNTFLLYYIFKIAYLIFDETTAFFSIVWSGFYIYYYYYSSVILRESLVQFLIIFIFYHFYVFLTEKNIFYLKNKNLWAFLFGILLITHTDAKYLFYIPMLFFVYLLYRKSDRKIIEYSTLCGILILLFFPWILRNYIAYDRLVLVNTRTLDKYTARLVSLLRPSAHVIVKNQKKDEKKVFPTEEERILVKQGMNPRGLSEYEIDIIKRDIYPPSTFFQKELYRFREMWIPFRFGYDYDFWPQRCREPYSLKHNVISLVFYGSMIPFFACGIFFIFKNKEKAGLFLLSPIIIHALLHIITLFGKERHRIQIDCFVILISMYGFLSLVRFIKTIRINKNCIE